MTEDSVKLIKKAGGSIIDHKPTFSSNSKLLFIGCGPILRIFSSDTGEHVQDVEISSALVTDKPEGSIVDHCLHPFDKNTVIVCFEEGRVIAWSFETNTVIYNKAYDVKGKNVVRMKLHVTRKELEVFDILLATKEPNRRTEICDMKVSIYNYSTGELKCTIQKRFDFRMHSWSVTSAEGKDFLAGIHEDLLSVCNLKTYKLNKDIQVGSNKKLGVRFFTCVICHPTEECIAVGDNSGRVIFYYDFLEPNNKSPSKVFHWHTLPVNDIMFSLSGSILYSGGNEHVLVKWTVDDPEVRHCLPRLSAPIVHLTGSTDNQFIAVSTLDNAILIVNPHMKIQCALQQFTWGFVSVPGQKLFPCGLVIDSRSNCLVMNGKPGHIQFYSPQYSSLIYNMDVVGQNYISQERTKNIVNSEVVAVQFSSDGVWLTTAQLRDDPEFRSDTFLKFWLFHRVSQTYKLSSCITIQHRVIKILYQSINEQEKTEDNDFNYLVATLCSDFKFRLWMNSSVKGQKFTWYCHSIGYYREHPLYDIGFSCDGSLLGAAFGHCLTVWDTETNEMKTSLAKGSEPLKQVVFAHEDSSFVVIGVTNNWLYVWNLLTLTLLWKKEMCISFIVADPRSDHIALFTPDNNLSVFKASDSNTVYTRNRLCEDEVEILCAIFFPVSQSVETQASKDSSWLSNSSLYFFTSTQELMAFEFQNKEFYSDNLAFVSEKIAPTPFKALIANKISSAVQTSETSSYLQLGVPWVQTMTQFIHSPAHAMPPVHLLCEPLLKSLVVSGPSES